MNRDVRNAALGVGIVFCIAMLAMTASVILDTNIERLTIGTLFYGFFVLFAVLFVVMILLALISAIRNPPDD